MRLIDAEKLIIKWNKLTKRMAKDGDGITPVDFGLVICELSKAPTVDAVEVVRCKDCKHWHEETGWCNEHSHFIGAEGEACHPWESIDWKMLDADDFCSYGERKEE